MEGSNYTELLSPRFAIQNSVVGDCNSGPGEQELWGYTNKSGVFEIKIDPGEYYVLSCKIECSGYPFDYTFENIIVVNGQVTIVEFPLHK